MEEIKDFNTIVGKNLLKLRKDKKLTQMEVAEKFNYSDKTISKWEKGESLPSVEVLCELADFYGITLNELTSENQPNQTNESKSSNKNKKNKTPRMISTRLMITLLSVGAVWLLATILFVVLKLCLDVNYYMSFMWAGVASCIVFKLFIIASWFFYHCAP